MSDPNPLARALALASTLRTRFEGLSRPARVLLWTTAAAAALLVAWLGWAAGHEQYAPLFTQLDAEDAANVVAKLKEQKVPYRLAETGGTTTVEVPESKVHEVRLDLAGAGLPRGGGVGFESFDKMHLGATEFEQRVLYRRALEGELARTIGSLSAVESARVHLVLPEKSVFVSRSEPASGTIVVKLRAGRALAGPEVGAIVHLTAASVPGLAPEAVALVTSDGAMLHKPRKAIDDATGGLDPDAASDRQAMETGVEDRVRTMLERIVGPGHADVRVAAELDPARVERVEDHYDPSKTAVRSLDESVERSGAETTVTGVPGAESNTPAGSATTASSAAAAPGTAPGGVVRETHTRNFEIDHVSEKRVQMGGTLRRLTVAVVVDGVPGEAHQTVPRGKEEIARLAALVASAAGADAKRGDVVTVDSVPFFAEAAASVDAPAASVAPARAAWRSPGVWTAAAAAAIVLVAVAIFAVRSRRDARPRAEAQPDEVALNAAPVSPALPAAPLLDPRAEAVALAAKDPATAALVLRAWLGGTGDLTGSPASRS